jgi:hypothetical protein
MAKVKMLLAGRKLTLTPSQFSRSALGFAVPSQVT